MVYRAIAPPPLPPDSPRYKFVSPPPPLSAGEQAVDFGKSVGSGIVRGLEGIPGTPGDVQQLTGVASDALRSKLGMAEKPGEEPSLLSQVLFGNPRVGQGQLPNTEDVDSVVRQHIGDFNYTPQTTAGRYGKVGGEFLPNIVGGPGRLATRAATRVALPAIGSETAGRLTEGTAYEPYARVAGAVAGSVTPNVAARAVTPFPAIPERLAAADTLEGEGVRSLTAGQRTGNRGLQYFESEMGGGQTDALLQRQGEQFTSAANRRSNLGGNRATPDVVDAGFERIGNDFNRLSATANAPFDPQLQNNLLDAVTNYHTRGGVAHVVEEEMNNIAHAAQLNGGHITGDAYQTIRSRLGEHIRATDGPTAIALRELQESLDDAIERHMPAAHMDEWRTARREYRNLLVLERASTASGTRKNLGIISPADLSAADIGQNRRAYSRGRSDFSDLAHAGEGVMTPLPNSGTAGRTAARNIIPGTLSILGAMGGSHFGAEGAGLGALAGAAAPRGLGYLTMSQPAQAILGNQLLRGPTAAGQNMARAALVQALLEQRRRAAGQ